MALIRELCPFQNHPNPKLADNCRYFKRKDFILIKNYKWDLANCINNKGGK